MEVVIKNGKFYRNGIEEPAKFGDIAQINALKKANEKRQSAAAELLNEELTTYLAKILFECPKCGQENKYDTGEQQEDWEFEPEDMDGEIVKCTKCKAHFELIYENDTLKLDSREDE